MSKVNRIGHVLPAAVTCIAALDLATWVAVEARNTAPRRTRGRAPTAFAPSALRLALRP